MNNQKNILIIEDEQQLNEIYQKKFVELGVKITIALTGKEGLDFAKSKPDLIILDIMLPGGLNGFDVLATLKKDKDLNTIPVLVLTNLDSERQTAMEMGAVDYIVKTDMDIASVANKIRTILNI